jgi:hypothetical protein
MRNVVRETLMGNSFAALWLAAARGLSGPRLPLAAPTTH